jgi:choline kinase
MASTRTAVILAAGVGSRLRPLTDDRPKALVEIHGKSVLSRAVDALCDYGVQHLIIATGYREDAIAERLADRLERVTLCHNPRYESTQNVVSLALCRDAVEGQAFFKLDGDVVFDPDVLVRLDSSVASLAVAVDTARKVDAEAMKVQVLDGKVVGFGKELPLQVSAGETIGIERIDAQLSPVLFEAIDACVAAGRTDVYYEYVYDQLVRGGTHAALVAVGDLRWTEIDDLADLERARELFAPSAAP